MFKLKGVFLAATVIAGAFAGGSAFAVETVEIRVSGGDDGLVQDLRAASLTEAARRDGRVDAQDVFASARSDYARLLAALYAQGYYSGVISVRLDGREAAEIAPLNAPKSIRRVEISVQTGPQFLFGSTRIAPLAAGKQPPAEFAVGQVAKSAVLRGAVEQGITDWRKAGHAKAALGAQSLIADHPRARLEADITLTPGPLVQLGQLRFAGQTGVRPERLAAIAGFRTGHVYSPEDIRKSADRLRRTGVFQAVALQEDETLGPGNTLDVTATLADMPLRRIGGGVEYASDDGLTVSGYWMHRNLLGGAERLRVDAKIARIGGAPLGFELGITFDRPATFTPDTNLTLSAQLARHKAGDFTLDMGKLGAGLAHGFSDRLTGSIGAQYSFARLNLGGSTLDFQHFSLPITLTWDGRDDKLDPSRGTWVQAEARPFLGLGTTGSGARLKLDARAYRAMGDRFVLAGRVQGGVVLGTDLGQTPADYRFYSGGGGTVRGHTFQSLGVSTLGYASGGNLFLGASVETRVKLTQKIGAVAFLDFGLIEDIAAPTSDNWHAGAGLGLRYSTGIGAIRLDVGLPVAGKPGSGPQIYLGIGQAF